MDDRLRESNVGGVVPGDDALRLLYRDDRLGRFGSSGTSWNQPSSDSSRPTSRIGFDVIVAPGLSQFAVIAAVVLSGMLEV